MKIKISILPVIAAALALPVAAQSRPAAKVTPAQNTAGPQNGTALQNVLRQMDAAAARFKSAEADFQWDQYQKVVDETDTQKGKIYFRRDSKGNTDMAAIVTEPDQKHLVFSEGKLRFYQPRIDQVTEVGSGKNRAEFESFLVLGFGGRGSDLAKQWNVQYLGDETIDGVKTAKLELAPQSERIRNMFTKFIIWVDPQRDVSLKQQAFEPSGDMRTAYYRNIKLNEKVSDEVFKLKTTGKTKVVKPQ